MNSLRIAMLVYNDFVNDLRVHKEARDLAAAGHRVRVFATQVFPDLAPEETRDGYEVVRLPLSSAWRTQARGRVRKAELADASSWKTRVTDVVRNLRVRREWQDGRMRATYARRALPLVSEWAPHVVHTHDLDTLDIGVQAAASASVPLLYDSHELWRSNNFLLKASARMRRQWLARESSLIARAQAVVTTTESRAAKLREWYGVEPMVVMNCQDASPVPRTRVLRDRLSLADDQRVLLYQGLIHADRGVFVALDALDHLPETFVFVAIGAGPDETALAREAARRHPTRAFVLPAVPHADLAPITASADIGLSLIQDSSLSYRLSAPNKLFEFMRAGLPIVASRFPEVDRLFEQGDLGERVDPADPVAVARAVIALEAGAERRATIADTARHLVTTRYNWARQMEKLLEFYAGLSVPR